MSKTIQLTQGQVAIVDDEDYEYLNQWKWCVIKTGRKTKVIFAYRIDKSGGKPVGILMHRLIANAPSDLYVRHNNGDRLDNRRENLILCDPTDGKGGGKRPRKQLTANGNLVCTKCGQEKPLNQFPKSGHAYGFGVHPHCRTCKNATYRRTHREKRRQGKRTVDPAKRRIYTGRWAEKYPEKNAAQNIVNRAVNIGALPRVGTQECVRCGKTAVHYHHHKGYSVQNWLNVVPVCNECHGYFGQKGSSAVVFY